MTEEERYMRLSYYWKEKDVRPEDLDLLRQAALSRQVSLARFRVDKNGKIIPCAKLTDEGKYFVHMLAPGKITRLKKLMAKYLCLILERTRN